MGWHAILHCVIKGHSDQHGLNPAATKRHGEVPRGFALRATRPYQSVPDPTKGYQGYQGRYAEWRYAWYILSSMSELVKNRCNDCDKEMEALKGAHVWCGTCGQLMATVASQHNMEEMSNG